MRSVHTLITLWLAVAVSSVTASPEQSPYSPTEWRQLENLLGQGIADGKKTAEKICGISPEIDNIAFQTDAGEPASNAQARRALLQGLHREQVMRLLVEADKGQRAEANLRSVDADNRALLARQFDQSGFPTTAEVGAQGVFAALMLTLHADPDLGLQRRGYDLMQASAANNAIPSTVPMMFRTLRANVLEGRQYTETYNVDGKDTSRIDPTTLAPQACYQAISGSTRNAWLKQHLGDL